jgi:hypothetical protein
VDLLIISMLSIIRNRTGLLNIIKLLSFYLVAFLFYKN